MNTEQLHQRLCKFYYENKRPMAELARYSGLSTVVIRAAINGQLTERTAKRLISTFNYLDSDRCKPSSYPTTRYGRKRRTLFVLIRIAQEIKLGQYGTELTDEFRDGLFIALKTAYKRPTEEAWRSVHTQYVCALMVRFGEAARANGVSVSTPSALRLVQKLQAAGLLK